MDRRAELSEITALGMILIADHLLAVEETIAEIREKLGDQKPRKDWYTVSEVADDLGRAEFTVREWCRLGRIYASKRACGRGNTQEWIVSDTEMERIRNEGLLPM